jgi:hypothetical protein
VAFYKCNNYIRNLVHRSFGRCLCNRLLSGSSMRFTIRCGPRRALYWELFMHKAFDWKRSRNLYTWFKLVIGFIHLTNNSNNLQSLTINYNQCCTIITYLITCMGLNLHPSLSLVISTSTAITTLQSSVQYLLSGPWPSNWLTSGAQSQSHFTADCQPVSQYVLMSSPF